MAWRYSRKKTTYLLDLYTTQNSEELEALTNPEFYKKGVNYIVITIEELMPISKKFFENIDHIKPKSVLFHFSKEANKLYGYIKLLQWYNLSSLYFYLQNLNR